MNRTGAEIRVGLTILVAVLVLFFGIMWGKGYKIKSERFPRIIHFTSISGLEPGARVLVSGVNKGKVDDINLYPDRVEVRIQLDKEVILYTDATIYIDSPELMGGKVISIDPGSSGIHAPLDEPLVGSPAVGMSELMTMASEMRDDIQVLLASLNTTLVTINETFGTQEVKDNLQSSLANLNRASKKLDNMLGDNAPVIANAVTQLDSSAQRVHEILKEHDEEVEQTIDNFAEVSVEIKTLITELQDITSTINNQEGTVGKLIYEPDLYHHLDSMLIHLDSLITKFNREGIKTHISLF
jgi:phospholipid/cholesterol/gamma-HCH transport system substrate-binding protein